MERLSRSNLGGQKKVNRLISDSIDGFRSPVGSESQIDNSNMSITTNILWDSGDFQDQIPFLVMKHRMRTYASLSIWKQCEMT
jgi:hypothetical protein